LITHNLTNRINLAELTKSSAHDGSHLPSSTEEASFLVLARRGVFVDRMRGYLLFGCEVCQVLLWCFCSSAARNLDKYASAFSVMLDDRVLVLVSERVSLLRCSQVARMKVKFPLSALEGFT
jgi:hypothetical protein